MVGVYSAQKKSLAWGKAKILFGWGDVSYPW